MMATGKRAQGARAGAIGGSEATRPEPYIPVLGVRKCADCDATQRSEWLFALDAYWEAPMYCAKHYDERMARRDNRGKVVISAQDIQDACDGRIR